MTNAVVVGVIGLLGVVVGGLLNGGVTYLLDRRREDRAARTAARIVLLDLVESKAAIKHARDHGQWPEHVGKIRLDQWRERRDALVSSSMPQHDIDRVLAAHSYLQWAVGFPTAEAVPKKFLDDAMSDLDQATFVLKRVGAYGPKQRLSARVAYRLRYRRTIEPPKD